MRRIASSWCLVVAAAALWLVVGTTAQTTTLIPLAISAFTSCVSFTPTNNQPVVCDFTNTLTSLKLLFPFNQTIGNAVQNFLVTLTDANNQSYPTNITFSVTPLYWVHGVSVVQEQAPWEFCTVTSRRAKAEYDDDVNSVGRYCRGKVITCNNVTDCNPLLTESTYNNALHMSNFMTNVCYRGLRNYIYVQTQAKSLNYPEYYNVPSWYDWSLRAPSDLRAAKKQSYPIQCSAGCTTSPMCSSTLSGSPAQTSPLFQTLWMPPYYTIGRLGAPSAGGLSAAFNVTVYVTVQYNTSYTATETAQIGVGGNQAFGNDALIAWTPNRLIQLSYLKLTSVTGVVGQSSPSGYIVYPYGMPDQELFAPTPEGPNLPKWLYIPGDLSHWVGTQCGQSGFSQDWDPSPGRYDMPDSRVPTKSWTYAYSADGGLICQTNVPVGYCAPGVFTNIGPFYNTDPVGVNTQTSCLCSPYIASSLQTPSNASSASCGNNFTPVYDLKSQSGDYQDTSQRGSNLFDFAETTRIGAMSIRGMNQTNMDFLRDKLLHGAPLFGFPFLPADYHLRKQNYRLNRNPGGQVQLILQQTRTPVERVLVQLLISGDFNMIIVQVAKMRILNTTCFAMKGVSFGEFGVDIINDDPRGTNGSVFAQITCTPPLSVSDKADKSILIPNCLSDPANCVRRVAWTVAAGLNAPDTGTCSIDIFSDGPPPEGNKLTDSSSGVCQIANFTAPQGSFIAPTPLQTGPPIPYCFPFHPSCVTRDNTGQTDLFIFVIVLFAMLLLGAIIMLVWQKISRDKLNQAAVTSASEPDKGSYAARDLAVYRN